jgi:replication-associated recombination protein RarA
MFFGPSGTGKDSATYLFASTYLKCPIEEIMPDENGKSSNYKFKEWNASDARGIDVVRDEIFVFASSILSKDEPRRIAYCNEAEGMTGDAQRAMKNLTEKLSHLCIFIFSFNNIKKIDHALISRSAFFRFDPIPFEEFKPWFLSACLKVGISCNTDVVDKIYNYYGGDLRRVITDFIDTYHDTEVAYWKPNNDMAIEIFNSKDPKAKLLSYMKRETIDADYLLQELYELNGYKNAHLFAQCAIAIGKTNPIFGLMDAVEILGKEIK